jgi:hypothetical protein
MNNVIVDRKFNCSHYTTFRLKFNDDRILRIWVWPTLALIDVICASDFGPFLDSDPPYKREAESLLAPHDIAQGIVSGDITHEMLIDYLAEHLANPALSALFSSLRITP